MTQMSSWKLSIDKGLSFFFLIFFHPRIIMKKTKECFESWTSCTSIPFPSCLFAAGFLALVTTGQLLIPCSDLGTGSPLCLTHLWLFDKTLQCATVDHSYGLLGWEVPIYSLLSAPKPLCWAVQPGRGQGWELNCLRRRKLG